MASREIPEPLQAAADYVHTQVDALLDHVVEMARAGAACDRAMDAAIPQQYDEASVRFKDCHDVYIQHKATLAKAIDDYYGSARAYAALEEVDCDSTE